jgi:hypothetical protein
LDTVQYPKVQFQPIQPIGARGLYTQEEIGKVQGLLTFGTERKVVENIIARRVAGMGAGGQGFSTLGMFDPDEMKELAHSTMRQLWGWFTDLGIFISGMIGFYIIFRVCKYVFGVVLNALQLYQTVGGGIQMLACLWNTLTMWVIHQQRRKDAKEQDEDPKEINDVEMAANPVPEPNAPESRTGGPPPRLYPLFPCLTGRQSDS